MLELFGGLSELVEQGFDTLHVFLKSRFPKLHFAKNDIPVLPVHDSFIITAGLFIELLEVMEKEFKKHIGVPIDIRNAEKSVRVRTRNNEDLIGYVLNEMEEFSDWTARNPLR